VTRQQRSVDVIHTSQRPQTYSFTFNTSDYIPPTNNTTTRPPTMSSKDRIPPPPPNAHPVRSKPRIGGVVFHFLASAVMLNGFKGLQHMPISDYMKGPVSPCVFRLPFGGLGLLISLGGFVRSMGVRSFFNPRPSSLFPSLINSSRSTSDHSQFLTIWGLFLSILTTTLGLASNMLPGLKILRDLKRMALLLALPLSMTISVIYVRSRALDWISLACPLTSPLVLGSSIR
jgi:hypothetical protein